MDFSMALCLEEGGAAREAYTRALVSELGVLSEFVDWSLDRELRRLEHITRCGFNQDLRGTLSASFRQAQKNKVAFADLIDEQIKAASMQTDRSNRRR